ncbi:hypothetical protein GSS87_00140 [Corynebacterium sp. 4HC-13]|uniref:MaoC family dehydratase n=1 Tax=Corynebacterium anserum TaxID=2684406 RepID=UPI001639588C|nr:MaoC/PaaZ C-terminal domain-containing protein [Corynebacterium anserum]MBC2680844.1 hypothetical protein [Corynebacterium anserum]
MTTVTYKELDSIPVLMDEYRNAVKDIIPGVGTKRSTKENPTTAYKVKGVKIDVRHLAAYNSATGLRLRNELPLTYPYVLSFPLVMKVMTSKDFPLTAVGLVHLNNTIEQTRPLTVDDVLDISVHAENLRPHTKGVLIDFITTVSVAGEDIWTQTSAFLAKGAKLSSSSPYKNVEPTDARLLDKAEKPEVSPTASYRVTPEDIKIYAEASGDKNPIHVSNLGAKAFGFPATIAHGMWSAATMLRGLEGQIPPAARFQVDFAKPVVLPASIAYFAKKDNTSWDLQLRKASKLDTLHATGRIDAL